MPTTTAAASVSDLMIDMVISVFLDRAARVPVRHVQ
jgi:hypothetical protein